LRKDWKPIFTVNLVILGLITLFIVRVIISLNLKEPNSKDPLNKDAADVMERSMKEFSNIVRRTLRG
jgi:ubiquitin-conjugating enzyme E2 M